MKRYSDTPWLLLIFVPLAVILLIAAAPTSTGPNQYVSERPLGTNFTIQDYFLMNTGNPPKTVRIAASNVVNQFLTFQNFPTNGVGTNAGGGNDKISTNVGTGFRTTLIDPSQRGGSNFTRYLQATQTVSALDGVSIPTSKKVSWPSSSISETSGNLDFAGNFIHISALNLAVSNRLLRLDAGNILTNSSLDEVDILRGHTNGNIVYLDTLGNDNSGQIGKFNNPFATPTNAAAAIRADGRANLLLYIRPGDYTVDTMRSGVNGAPVWFSKITNLTIWAYGVRFVSTTTNEGCQIIYSNCPNLKVYGLTQIGTRQSGASGDRSGVLFGATGWADTNLAPTLVDCVWKDWSRHANTPFAGACTPDATIVRCAGYNIGATNTADLGFADGQVWGVKGPRQTILSMRGSNNVREVEAEGVLMACQTIDGLLIDDLRSVGTRDAAIYIIPDFLGAYYNNVTVTRLFVDGLYSDGANTPFSRGVVDRGGTNHVYDGGTIQNCYESMLIEADSTNNVGLKIVNYTFLNANQHHIDLADNQGEIGKISDAYIAGNTFILSGYDCIGGTFNNSIVENNTILTFATNSAASSYPAIWVYTAGNTNDPATNNIIRNNRISNGRVGIRVETNAVDNRIFGNDLRNLAVSDYAINDSRNFVGITFPEVSSQPTAATNTVLVYGKESGGATKLFYKDDTGAEVGPLGTGGGLGVSLASASSAAASTIVVSSVPSNLVANTCFVVIDPYTTNCEIRNVSSISGTTLGVNNGSSTYNLHYAHSAGVAVLFIDGDRSIPWTWYGAIAGNTNTAIVKANVTGFNRLSTNLYGLSLRGPGRIFIPSGIWYVDGQLKPERELTIEGVNPVGTAGGSEIAAANEFVFTSDGETSIVHPQRDGTLVEYVNPGVSGRWIIRNLKVNGRSISNSCGILSSPQQPDYWESVRVDNCAGLYGIAIVDCQQHIMNNIELVANATGLRYRSAQFVWAYNVNIEQSSVKDFVAEAQPGGIDCHNNHFIGLHVEDGAISSSTNFHILSGDDWMFKNVWFSNSDVAHTFLHFNYIGGVSGKPVFTIEGLHVNTPSTNCIVIHDVQRGLTRTATQINRAIQSLVSGHLTTAWAQEIRGDPGGGEDQPPHFANGISLTAIGGPSILGGAGAPSAAATNGSMWLRNNGTTNTTLYVRENGNWVPVQTVTPSVIEFALSDESTALTAGTNKLAWRAPWPMTLTAIRASLSTASTNGVVTVDINEEGVTMLSVKLTIDQDEKTSVTAATSVAASDLSIAEDAEITFDLDTAGARAKGLKVKLYYLR